MANRVLGAWLLCLLLVTASARADKARVELGGKCTVDAECDDHVYCNGAERCNGSCGAGAPACGAGATCDEAAARCNVPRIDADGDGLASAATAAGNDCDDSDRNRFPGNGEVWDAADHDEDCDLATHGLPVDAGGRPLFGRQGRAGPVQICSGEGVVILDGTVGAQAWFHSDACGYDRVCVPQPNGDGICEARPGGYVAPPVLVGIPMTDQAPPAPAAGGAAAISPPRPLASHPPRPTTSALIPAVTPVRPVAPVAVPAAAAKKTACPPGQAFSVAVARCIPIPP